jgi:hypothetical protein
MENGKWKMVNGKWKMENVPLCGIPTKVVRKWKTGWIPGRNNSSCIHAFMLYCTLIRKRKFDKKLYSTRYSKPPAASDALALRKPNSETLPILSPSLSLSSSPSFNPYYTTSSFTRN